MAHSDDDGLVLPPKLAPVQAAIVPIYRKAHQREKVLEVGEKVRKDLVDAGVATVFDTSPHMRPGAKFYHWERKGVPLRLELGPRDIDAGHVTVRRRTGGDREQIPFAELSERIPAMLDEVQQEIYERALRFREENTVDLQPGSTLVDTLESGDGSPLRFVRAHWCGSAECETKIKTKTRATIRCMELDAEPDEGPCLVCGETSPNRVVFARSY